MSLEKQLLENEFTGQSARKYQLQKRFKIHQVIIWSHLLVLRQFKVSA